jgi:WD40 repeat protein/predicted Ser/Thr protein kinase
MAGLPVNVPEAAMSESIGDDALPGTIGGAASSTLEGGPSELREALRLNKDLTSDEWVDLACVDLIERWRAGQRIPAETYLEFHTAIAESSFEVIYSEFAVRTELGESPGEAEYSSRFPHLAARLHRQLAVDRALGANTVFSRGASGPLAVDAQGDPSLNLPTVEGYRIERELGRGGMGVVYLAWQSLLNRAVALKMVLAGARAPQEAVARFLAEAQAIARVRHPSVVEVYAVGEHEGRPFFAMEYVGGGTLAARLGGIPLAARDAASLVESLARGVHHAHQLGVVHRDLKPSNVLLGEDGSAKVADFGLAKLTGSESGLTLSNSVLGSPSYMAPEQADGRNHDVGPAADVYALGTILYESITGRPPFRATTVLETLALVKSAEPVAPCRLQPSLPRDLETVCLKCLAKSPPRRYATAEALADDLRRFLEHRPVLARRTGPAGRLWRWCWRNPGIAGMAAALAMLLLTITAVATGAALRSRRDLYLARMNNVAQAWDTSNVRQVVELLEPYRHDPWWLDQRRFEWYYWWRQAHAARGTLVGHRERLAAARFSHDGATLGTADSSIIMLWDANTGARTAVLDGHAGPVRALAFSPDDATVASAGDDPFVLLWDRRTGSPKGKLIAHNGRVAALEFSADGGTLVAACLDDMTQCFDLATGAAGPAVYGRAVRDDTLPADDHPPAMALAPGGWAVGVGVKDGTVTVRRVILPELAAGAGRPGARFDPPWAAEELRVVSRLSTVRSLAFSHDGRRLAMGYEDKTIVVRDLTTGRDVCPALVGHDGTPWSLSFSPDARFLASGGLDNSVILWELSRGRLRTRLRGHANQVQCVDFAPDGKTVASGASDYLVKLWDVSDDRPHEVLEGHAMAVEAVAFSTDGQLLASASRDRTVRLWNVAGGTHVTTLEGHSDQVRSVAFAPDGKTLAAGSWDGTITLWDAGTFRLTATLGSKTTGDRGNSRIVYSPDGKTLAAGSRDGSITLWDVAARRERDHFQGHTGWVASLAYSPDGATIASGTGSNEIRLWNGGAGRRAASLLDRDTNVDALAFSPDGATLASGINDGSITLWNVSGRLPRAVLYGHATMVAALAFSPDGMTLASGSRDNTIKLWDVTTGVLKSTLNGHSSNVVSIAFSPDGKTLASGSLDNTVRLWRTK